MPTTENIVEAKDVIQFYVRTVIRLLEPCLAEGFLFLDHVEWTHSTRLPI